MNPAYHIVSHALSLVRTQPQWVVLVCTSPDATQQCREELTRQLPLGVVFSGRTAVFPEGGKVAVVGASEPVFLPKGTAFTMFVFGVSDGGSNATTPAGVNRWRKRAKKGG